MDDGALANMIGEVERLRGRFAGTAPRAWEPTTAAAETTVQLGHLALCLLRRHGADITALRDPLRPITDTGDELADVVLSSLSVGVLAGVRPTPTRPVPEPGAVEDELDAFLRLLVASGWLAEAALVDQGYRHRPTGSPPSMADAGAATVAACDTLAGALGLDLVEEFTRMVADADAFLDTRGEPR